MRTTVRVALGAAAAVLAGIVAPAAAQAAPPSLGPTISTLPAFASDGGRGATRFSLNRGCRAEDGEWCNGAGRSSRS